MDSSEETHLEKGKWVEVIGLTSIKGQEINGRIAAIDGNLNSEGRYPVKLKHHTGEEEQLGIKPKNLNASLTHDQEAAEAKRLSFINYTRDARIREGHGMFLEQVLMLLRWAVNMMHTKIFFQGDFNSFIGMDRRHPSMAILNSQVYSYYRAKPLEVGFKCDPEDNMSPLHATIKSLLANPDSIVEIFGKKAKYERDGPGGRLIVRNMIRFMKPWDRERIHGEFWIHTIAQSGTIVVQTFIVDDCYTLGNVYLVKGMASQVGEHIPPQCRPLLCRATFLPLYDFLVYDGVMTALPITTTPEMLVKLNAHVSTAVREQNVIYCGESAANGLWDTEPPELPTVSSDGELKMDIDAPIEYKPSASELGMAKKIIEYAKRIGFKGVDKGKKSEPVLTVRRMDYTRELNPNRMVVLLFNHRRDKIHFFKFSQWPTYTLDDILSEIFKAIKAHTVVPQMLWLDEKSLVQPMMDLLRIASNALGFDEEIDVKWYPPPSEEELLQREVYDW